MGLHCSEHVLGRAALSELTVTVVADDLNGTFHIGLVGYERLTEVVGLTCCLEDLGLEERDRGVVPAGTRTVLVFHTGDRDFLDDSKDGLVGVFSGFLLSGSRCTEGHDGQECER